LIEGKYNQNQWLEEIKKSLPNPAETYPENNERCKICYKIRLVNTARFAKENNFKSFGTTLSVSLYKDTNFINNFGNDLAEKYNLQFFNFKDIDPKISHQKSYEFSKKYNLYRQKYCGCEFSIKLKTKD